MTTSSATMRQPVVSLWSKRILIAGAVGICFLTLYPFRADFHRRLPDGSLPFLLGTAHKSLGLLDAILNVLLFVPFGFGLAGKLREISKSRVATFFLTYAAGALFSYGIEFSQFFIPPRDSGWADVVTNSAGALVGSFLFIIAGELFLRPASRWERRLEAWVSLSKASVILSVFWVVAITVSVPLQLRSRLSNWDRNCLFTIKNNAAGDRAWKGKVSVLEVWGRALPRQIARELTAHDGDRGPGDILAAYDFTDSSTFKDQATASPELSRSLSPSPLGNANLPMLHGKPDLIGTLQKTNRFSLRVVFTPASENSSGDIVSISRAPRTADLVLSQEGSELAFWFETPLTTRRLRSTWRIPAKYTATRPLDVLYSYDGSTLSLYMNGRQMPLGYQLGPGVAVGQFFFHVAPYELEACNYIYHALLFLPPGMLLGIAARGDSATAGHSVIYGLLFTAPVVLVELLLSLASDRSPYAGNLVLSAALIAAGYFWINTDRV